MKKYLGMSSAAVEIGALRINFQARKAWTSLKLKLSFSLTKIITAL